ncbi:aldehyde dehydrogenase family protein [Streptomyces sp. NPDC003703]|uniref:aldehyde dehydrogenase family protein n=1 Tax=Streptomyces sp. NPDC003283 TaxID=3364681 RepID=UPI0036853549
MELADPATVEVTGRVVLGREADVSTAVAAAERAFVSYSQTSPQECIELLERILTEFDRRAEHGACGHCRTRRPADAGPRHMCPPSGCRSPRPSRSSERMPSPRCAGRLRAARKPWGAAGLITPWNFPVLQPTGKTVSALAAGCTVVLKSAQLTP